MRVAGYQLDPVQATRGQVAQERQPEGATLAGADVQPSAGALAYEPDGSAAHLVFQLRPGAYNDQALIDFLSELNDLEQRPAVLIWDGLPSHRSGRMRDWLAEQRDWLTLEPLPGYAHDLNPVEQVWGTLKSRDLANLCSDTIGQVANAAQNGLDRIGSDAALCFAFLRHTGLRI